MRKFQLLCYYHDIFILFLDINTFTIVFEVFYTSLHPKCGPLAFVHHCFDKVSNFSKSAKADRIRSAISSTQFFHLILCSAH